MNPTTKTDSRTQTVEISRSVLQTSQRASQGSPSLLRSENLEISDQTTLEVLNPLLERADREPVRVLHVDDNHELADLTAEFLERFDETFEVTVETNVVAALDQLRETRFDCVVSDYQMPNTDGLEFLEIVREQYPDIPFILYTGRGSEEIASEAIEAGVTDYMQKSGGSDQYEVLGNRVANAVEQYRTRQQFWDALSWYQRLVEQDVVGVFVVQNDNFVYVNQKFATVFNYQVQELVGEPLELIFPSRERASASEIFARSGEKDETFKHTFIGQRRGGEQTPVEIHGGPVEYDDNTAAMGILRIGLDSSTDDDE